MEASERDQATRIELDRLVERFAHRTPPELHDEIIERFTGPDYGYMWPFPAMVRSWIAKALVEIESLRLRDHGDKPD